MDASGPCASLHESILVEGRYSGRSSAPRQLLLEGPADFHVASGAIAPRPAAPGARWTSVDDYPRRGLRGRRRLRRVPCERPHVGAVVRVLCTAVTRGSAFEHAPPSLDQPEPSNGTRLRPDIEGLRAVAVGLVLVYHADVAFLPGGFVGVDVFFVISGFLITALLLKELRTTGTIQLGRFYARRAKRLLPAAGLVLAVVALLTLALLPRTRWVTVGWDVVASTFYLMNWRLADQSVDYLTADNAESPLQHFWSLGVEEQYYLVWPLLLLLVSGSVLRRRGRGGGHRRRSQRSTRNRTLVIAFLLVAGPSFIWSVHLTAADPGAAYFVTTTRMWELAVGALLAMFGAHLGRIPTTVAAILGWLGLGSVITTGLLLTTATPFPGAVAAIPALGTALVLATGQTAGRYGPGPVLSLKPLVWVGGISYSVYLWHWPLLVVAESEIAAFSVWHGVAVVAFSLLPAWASTRLLENPIRRSDRFASPAGTVAVGLVSSFGAALAGLLVVWAAWPPPPPPAPLSARVAVIGGGSGDAPPRGAEVLADRPAGDPAGATTQTVEQFTPSPTAAKQDLELCLSDERNADPAPCVYGDRTSEKVMVLVGDSHAGQWIAPLAEIAAGRKWRLVAYVKQLCPYADVIPPSEGTSSPYEVCVEWNAAVQAEIAAMDPQPVLVVTSNIQRDILTEDGTVLQGEAAAAELADGLQSRWAQLAVAGTPVLALGNTPWPGIDVPDCVSSNASDLLRCAVPRDTALQRSSDALLRASTQVPGVTHLDLFDAICPVDPCAPIIGGVLVYADSNHLTATYATTLRNRIESTIETIVPA
jgi:peptidoglycan/LPS O-acetylase OafA/YrhL